MNNLMTDGHYRVAQNTNLPAIMQFGQVIVAKGSYSDTVTQIGIGCVGNSAATPLCMFRHGIGTETIIWSEWQPVATATPPQELALPLEAGVTPRYLSIIGKDLFENTVVRATLSLPNGDIGEIDTCTFPVGYRPSSSAELPVTLLDGANQAHAGTAKIENGIVRVQRPATGYIAVCFNWVFTAPTGP